MGQIYGKFLSSPKFTRRKFFQFCRASFCTLSAAYLFAFPDNSGAQLAKKGLIRAKLSPYFGLLGGGKSNVNCVQGNAAFPKVKVVFVECERTGRGNIIA